MVVPKRTLFNLQQFPWAFGFGSFNIITLLSCYMIILYSPSGQFCFREREACKLFLKAQQIIFISCSPSSLHLPILSLIVNGLTTVLHIALFLPQLVVIS